MNRIIIYCLMTASVQLHAAEINPTSIANIRTYTDNQQTVGARSHTVFTITSPLTAGCTCLYLKPTDKDSLSLLLMAKAQNSKVLVGYEESLRSPFNNTACAAVHIELL